MGYLTASASSISFCPLGTDAANFAYELLGEVEPSVVIRVAQRDHFHLVVFECLEGLRVHRIGLALVISLGVLAGLDDGVLLRFAEAVKARLRHQHRLVHEPQGIVAWPGQAIGHFVEPRGRKRAKAGIGAGDDAGLERVVDFV